MKLKFLQNRRFKHGSLATVLTVGFVAVIVLINIVVGLILERYPLNIDMSADNRFELTQDSVDFIGGITMPVEIYVCNNEQEYQQGTMYKQAYEIIKDYGKRSDKISVKFVDLIKDPTFSKKYPDQNLTSDDILIKTQLREKKITSSSLFSSAQNTYTGQYTYSSKAEQTMTSAIMYVTDEKPIGVSLLTGLSNADVSGYVSLLESNNYSVTEQNFLTEEINQDASFVILPQPQSDLSAEQADKLSNYLDNDGKFDRSLVFIASVENEIGPVLKAFLADWGMEVGNEIIAETNSANIISSPFQFLNEVKDEDLSAAMGTQQPVVTVNARPISLLFETKDNRTAKALLGSSESGILYEIDNENFNPDEAKKGEYITAAICTRLKYDGTTPLKSNVVAVSAQTMFNSTLLSNASLGNSNAAVSITNTFAEKKETVKILPVSFTAENITITTGQVIANIVFVVIIVLAVMALGIVVWLRRRHL